MTARRVVVHGQVQGVFFRDSTRREASRHGVSGWVANRPDGTVEAWFEGDEDAVSAMVDYVRTGPPQASVDRVDVDEVQPEALSSFEVR